jgi:hypothetical protein
MPNYTMAFAIPVMLIVSVGISYFSRLYLRKYPKMTGTELAALRPEFPSLHSTYQCCLPLSEQRQTLLYSFCLIETDRVFIHPPNIPTNLVNPLKRILLGAAGK